MAVLQTDINAALERASGTVELRNNTYSDDQHYDYKAADSAEHNSENNTVNNSSIVDVAYRIFNNDLSDNHVTGDQRDITQEEVNAENTGLKAPLNTTDPIVWHDPTFIKGIIMKPVANELGEDSTGATSVQQASHKIDGVFIPLVQVNEILVAPNDVVSMTLSSTGIYPELQLTIDDPSNKFQAVNSAGINNKVMLMVMPPIDGIYKKIQLPFYITDTSTLPNNRKIFFCRFKLLEMEQKQIGEMNYPDKYEWPGCDRCKQPKAKLANTWETLHYVAKKTGLGFSSTEKCKEVNDRQVRRFNSTYLDSISEILKTSGTDTDNIFDAWIDLYGYITMVNLPWILGNSIEPNNLAIYGFIGVHNTEGSGKLPDPAPQLVNRTLTNSNKISDAPHNLRYDTYEIDIDNQAYDIGTLTTYKYFAPSGSGGNNNIVEFQVQISEHSKQGAKTDEYETNNVVFLGTDMSGKNLLKQRVLNTSYMISHKMKIMKLHLPKANFGLQRGTLVNLVIVETEASVKYHIINSTKNMFTDNMDPQAKPIIDNAEVEGDKLEVNEIIANGDIELPNTALSGMYYINGIEYIFKQRVQQIEQVLYLIKKGPWYNYVDSNSTVPINDKTLKK